MEIIYYCYPDWLDESQAAKRIQEILAQIKKEVNGKVSSFSHIHEIIEQREPFEMTPDEFQAMKKGKSAWNREHVVEVEAKTLYRIVKKLAKRHHLHSLRTESITKDEMLMGVIAGTGKGKFSGARLSVTITLVGKVGEGISKVRIDVISDDSELNQIAASEFFERLQIEMQDIEEQISLA